MTTLTATSGFDDLRRAISLYRVWLFQAYQQVAGKYKRSLLGPFWVAGSMVATSLSLALVFGALFGNPLREILPYIMGGILVWGLVGLPLNEAPEIFVSFGGIIKNHAYPYMFFTFTAVARNLILFAHNIVVFWIAMALVRAFAIPNWEIIPGLILTALTAFFLSTPIAMLASRYRDIRFLFPYIGQLVFFMTPIFWRADQVKSKRKLIVAGYNPLFHLVEIVRAPLLGSRAALEHWIWALGTLAIAFALWLVCFSAFRRRIAFWV